MVPLHSRPQPRWSLVVSLVAVLGALLQPAQAADPGQVGDSLKWIPADAACYGTMLHCGAQWEAVLQSRAWAKLKALPAVHTAQQKIQAGKKRGHRRLTVCLIAFASYLGVYGAAVPMLIFVPNNSGKGTGYPWRPGHLTTVQFIITVALSIYDSKDVNKLWAKVGHLATIYADLDLGGGFTGTLGRIRPKVIEPNAFYTHLTETAVSSAAQSCWFSSLDTHVFAHFPSICQPRKAPD